MSDTTITISLPTVDPIEDDGWETPERAAPAEEAVEDTEEATEAAPVEEGGSVSKLRNRPSPGRPRKSGVATKPAAGAKAAKPTITKGKPAVTSKRTRGKDITVGGVAAGTTMTKEQKAKVDRLTKRLGEVNALEDKRSSYMWEVAQITSELLAPEGDAVPMKQKDLANEIKVHPTNVSIWAKTWKLFGDEAKRVKVKGVEASFNDHVERARMLKDDGTPGDPELYKAIEDAVEAEDGVSFAVAKRSVRQGPSVSKIDINGARDRVAQFATKLDELAGPNPNTEAVFVSLSALSDTVMAVRGVVARAKAQGHVFSQANQQLGGNLEGLVSELADLLK